MWPPCPAPDTFHILLCFHFSFHMINPVILTGSERTGNPVKMAINGESESPVQISLTPKYMLYSSFFFFVCTAPLVQSIGCMSDSAINSNKPSSRTGFNLGSSEIYDKDKRKVSLSREISVSNSLMIILHEDYILIVFSLENIPQYSLESLENVPGFFVN